MKVIFSFLFDVCCCNGVRNGLFDNTRHLAQALILNFLFINPSSKMDDLMSLDWNAKPNGNSNNDKKQTQINTSSSTFDASRLKATGNSNMIRNSQFGSNQPISSSNTSSYNFDSLTRSLNNSSPNSIQPQRSGNSNNRTIPSTSTPAATSTTPSTSSDAFSSLLSFDGSSFSSNLNQANSNMSMAERQNKFESDRREKAERERRMNEARWGNGAGWENMDSKTSSR